MRHICACLSLFLASILGTTIFPSTAQGQQAFGPMIGLPPPPGPLMYIRFTGPAGTKITLYRGFDAGQTLELPVTVGFRPGYAYRFAVTDLPRLPRQVFCPSLEVRGTLALLPKLRNADFPATIHFTEEEFGRALTGSFIKKVVVLERPDLALPLPSTKDESLEIPVPPSRDPMIEAAERGQPLVVFQLGQRFLTPQEMNAMAAPGTVLLPGERILGTPRLAPYLLWKWHPVYDPVHGPRHPSEFVTLYDGGDSGAPAGFDRANRLKGLDPTDTVAEYTDSKGAKRLAVSNRVALCVPRFIVVKTERALARAEASILLDKTRSLHAPLASVGLLALKEESQQKHAEAIGTQMRLSGLFHSTSTLVVGRLQGLEIRSSLASVESVAGIAAGPRETEPADGPLRIIKWPDKTGVNVGEIVTFYLKYSNTGGQPITSIVVSDNLTARLEYVKGSTKTDRDATFTMQANEVGSTLLRWEFTAPLLPREHGLITFQVRVR